MAVCVAAVAVAALFFVVVLAGVLEGSGLSVDAAAGVGNEIVAEIWRREEYAAWELVS